MYAVCRPVGFDIAQGERVLTAGCTLGSAEIGLLASIGVAQVNATNPRSPLTHSL